MTGPSKKPRKTFFQPASKADLNQFPPSNDDCRAVRGMLRDLADGELAAKHRQSVEEHVHTCRQCALALARAESEIWRLRQLKQDCPDVAGLPAELPAELPADLPAEFTAKVMGRVYHAIKAEAVESLTQSLGELAREERSAHSPSQGFNPSQGFTSRVMSQVQVESLRWSANSTQTGKLQKLWHGLQQPWVLPLAALLLVSLALLVQKLPTQQSGDWQVARAQSAYFDSAVGRQALQQGMDLAAFSQDEAVGVNAEIVIQTEAGGYANLALSVGDSQQSQVLQLGEQTQLALATPFVLHRGELDLQLAAAKILHLQDGTQLDFQPGHYALQAKAVQRFDAAVLPAADLRVRLLVYQGQVQLRRNGVVQQVVEGRIARFSTWSPVQVDILSDLSLWNLSLKKWQDIASRPETVELPDSEIDDRHWFGQILDPRTQEPVSGASVGLRTHRGYRRLSTDEEGRFQLQAEAELLNQYVVVEASSPEGDRGYGPLPLLVTKPSEGIGYRLYLDTTHRRLAGQIQDASLGAPDRIRLQPCVVDEVFGLLEKLGPYRSVGANGSFDIRGLPRVLESHLRLVVLAYTEDRAPSICYVAPLQSTDQCEDGSELSLQWILDSGVSRQLGGLPAEQQLTILEEVQGLPAGAAWQVRHVSTDAQGSALLAGSGQARLFLWQSQSPLQALVAQEGGYALDASVPPPASLQQPAYAEYLPATLLFPMEVEHRFARVQQIPDSGLRSYVSAHGAESRLPRPGTYIFLRDAAGQLSFLGEFDGLSALPYASPTQGQYELIGLAPDGAVGQLKLQVGEGAREDSLPLRASGTLMLPAELRRQLPAGAVIRLQSLTGAGVLLRTLSDLPGENEQQLQQIPADRYRIILPDGKTRSLRVAPEQVRRLR